ncbi:MAG: 30S ribosomal protein S7 [Deltaproteobacteria bacterium]|nr:30S ribosomal protein S7 [Deltaproteobacteria bacterium]
MARKKRDFSREVLPDPKYGDIVLTRTINVFMKDGKKGLAETALYKALEIIAEKTGQDALEVFHKALDNIKPVVEVRSRRVGGATYQVPTEVPGPRAQSLAIRWLVASANSRSEKRLFDRIANELLDAFGNKGTAIKQREDTHRMAEANKAFAHFRW